ncbi:MAG: sigma-70 family RNA polymerase sigma factor [Bacteroidota bacterium]
MPESVDITHLLGRARDGDASALETLIPLVYDELRRIAQRQRRGGRAGETVNTTALVHEAYEKLARGSPGFVDRQHFFRIAARAMREVLADHARAQTAQKRGGGSRPLPLHEAIVARAGPPERILALSEALDRLRMRDARQADIVDLRYFVGLTIPETAEVLDLSPATVKRDWTVARAWLQAALAEAP